MDTWLEMGGWRHYNDQIYTQPPCDSHTIWAKFSVRKNSQGFSQKYLQSQPFSNFSVLMILLFFQLVCRVSQQKVQKLGKKGQRIVFEAASIEQRPTSRSFVVYVRDYTTQFSGNCNKPYLNQSGSNGSSHAPGFCCRCSNEHVPFIEDSQKYNKTRKHQLNN